MCDTFKTVSKYIEATISSKHNDNDTGDSVGSFMYFHATCIIVELTIPQDIIDFPTPNSLYVTAQYHYSIPYQFSFMFKNGQSSLLNLLLLSTCMLCIKDFERKKYDKVHGKKGPGWSRRVHRPYSGSATGPL